RDFTEEVPGISDTEQCLVAVVQNTCDLDAAREQNHQPVARFAFVHQDGTFRYSEPATERCNGRSLWRVEYLEDPAFRELTDRSIAHVGLCSVAHSGGDGRSRRQRDAYLGQPRAANCRTSRWLLAFLVASSGPGDDRISNTGAD